MKTSSRFTRVGARLSQATQDSMHMARDHAVHAVQQSCTVCQCSDCMSHLSALDELAQDADIQLMQHVPAITSPTGSTFVRSAPGKQRTVSSALQATPHTQLDASAILITTARTQKRTASPTRPTTTTRAAISPEAPATLHAQLGAATALATTARANARR